MGGANCTARTARSRTRTLYTTNTYSQAAGGTKIHVYIPWGNLNLGLYCTFKRNKYISVCRAR